MTASHAAVRPGWLFPSVREAALRRRNPRMTDDAIRSMIENAQALPPPTEGNRRMPEWLRGERQWGYMLRPRRHGGPGLRHPATPCAER